MGLAMNALSSQQLAALLQHKQEADATITYGADFRACSDDD